jgi:hypothetical protein
VERSGVKLRSQYVSKLVMMIAMMKERREDQDWKEGEGTYGTQPQHHNT